MGVKTKDIKILWSKSAGRCSMPDCRLCLVAESSDAVPSKNVLVGENCHIVGEKETSPRGRSMLTDDERSRYPNLILLCRNHHKVIDDDEHEWPIERLHQIKADHEIWVETALTMNISVDEKWYSNLINAITDNLYLFSWEWLSDNILRDIVPQQFICGVSSIDSYLFKAIYPHKYPELEASMDNLIKRARQYTDHYTSNSFLDTGNNHRPIKFYKEEYPNPNYHSDLADYNKWNVKCTRLIFNITVALNIYAEQVRKHVNPDYFKLQGKFVVNDSIGVLNNMLPVLFLPNEYYPDEMLENVSEEEIIVEQLNEPATNV